MNTDATTTTIPQNKINLRKSNATPRRNHNNSTAPLTSATIRTNINIFDKKHGRLAEGYPEQEGNDNKGEYQESCEAKINSVMGIRN